ncbi:MAG: hypothetical protein QOF61_851, partial [Acidobacteriota bacterium]|nr:hypothetical protein [Acidobacteriota bacterium]
MHSPAVSQVPLLTDYFFRAPPRPPPEAFFAPPFLPPPADFFAPPRAPPAARLALCETAFVARPATFAADFTAFDADFAALRVAPAAVPRDLLPPFAPPPLR